MRAPEGSLTQGPAAKRSLPLVDGRIAGKQAAERDAGEERVLPVGEVLLNAVHVKGVSPDQSRFFVDLTTSLT